MSLVPEAALDELRQEFNFTAVEEPDIADYMYRAGDLAYLAGKNTAKSATSSTSLRSSTPISALSR